VEVVSLLTGARGLDERQQRSVLEPYLHAEGLTPRYYQDIAINRTIEAIVKGRRRLLLAMATGTGKTPVAFQICWKLWNSGWNRTGEYRKPRILYLADRNVLVDDPKDKTFAAFGDARQKIEGGKVLTSREIYFSTYQAIAEDEARPGLYRRLARDFFDLVIVDECHRGSARADSVWREILDYFHPATQLGMTATPLREDTRNSYEYFGDPLYTYSLRDGIDDGFLAPYRVYRIVTDVDATGWRPSPEDLDRYGRSIPDQVYGTRDFERSVALRARTHAIARHLADFLKATNRFDKTIVFCVDQEHADEMRMALNNLNADLVRQYPDYVCRVTADEGDIGRGHLGNFQDVEKVSPVILTTSQLLTTGVDAPMVRNVVLARVIGSMTEFKQIIGRGTRVREDYGKLWFNIVDYTGATRLFADPRWDDDPIESIVVTIGPGGEVVSGEELGPDPYRGERQVVETGAIVSGGNEGEQPGEPRKYYFDSGRVEIVADVVYELDEHGKQIRAVSYTDYARNRVLTLFRSAHDLESAWRVAGQRQDVVAALETHGISLTHLAEAVNQPDADPLDLLCHLAFNAPLRTRRERAERLAKGKQDFFDKYGPAARQILRELLDKYSEHGPEQLKLPDVLGVPPISEHGNASEIAQLFGGAAQLRAAVEELQALLYAA